MHQYMNINEPIHSCITKGDYAWHSELITPLLIYDLKVVGQKNEGGGRQAKNPKTSANGILGNRSFCNNKKCKPKSQLITTNI